MLVFICVFLLFVFALFLTLVAVFSVLVWIPVFVVVVVVYLYYTFGDIPMNNYLIERGKFSVSFIVLVKNWKSKTKKE